MYPLCDLVFLLGTPMCRCAVEVPIPCRFGEVISTKPSIGILYIRLFDKKDSQEGHSKWIFKNHPYSSFQTDLDKLEQYSQIVISILLSFYNLVHLFPIMQSPIIRIRKAECTLTHGAEVYAREKSKNKVSILPPPYIVKQAWFAIISILNCLEQVLHMVSLSEVILNIIILSWNAQLYKLLLECPTLLKEAMNFSVYYHRKKIKMGRLTWFGVTAIQVVRKFQIVHLPINPPHVINY